MLRPKVGLSVDRHDIPTPFADISLEPVPSGGPKVFSVTLRDLRAHEREKERSRIYESLLEAVSDAVVLVDRDGLIQMANAGRVLFGRRRGHAVGDISCRSAIANSPFRRNKYLVRRSAPLGIGRKLSATQGGTEFPARSPAALATTTDLSCGGNRDVTDGRKRAQTALSRFSNRARRIRVVTVKDAFVS